MKLILLSLFIATKVSWLVKTDWGLMAGTNKTAYTSADAMKWQTNDMSTQGNVIWSDGKRFIGSSWPGKMSWSADGKIWEKANELTANGINRVVKAEAR